MAVSSSRITTLSQQHTQKEYQLTHDPITVLFPDLSDDFFFHDPNDPDDPDDAAADTDDSRFNCHLLTPWSFSGMDQFTAGLKAIRARKSYFASSITNIPYHRLINLANRTFGFDGWSTEIVPGSFSLITLDTVLAQFEDNDKNFIENYYNNLNNNIIKNESDLDFDIDLNQECRAANTERTLHNTAINNDNADPDSGVDKKYAYNVKTSITVKITLSDGFYHQSIGYGQAQNYPSKPLALQKSKKESVTNAIKACFADFPLIFQTYRSELLDEIFHEPISSK
ncbi:uncharacterized protein ASCRUDRAFT_115723 [Ascoidea rubescens DSM 1968]|uniref:DNA repair and recombination protein RAD52 n=1 Tax=Ascoidea rubescens DSM 1968 TaxID=1344418 RepID=A0A1D2VBI5_9ASCO|nr:hypothetical protein ASCRUDRAFT_115723 [Ascoidea rubescens DSM 1968]ODV59038.1 hypothetical protein ASCRUDRAFT_115723 [Ascoidea rubescens DSM 1968]